MIFSLSSQTWLVSNALVHWISWDTDTYPHLNVSNATNTLDTSSSLSSQATIAKKALSFNKAAYLWSAKTWMIFNLSCSLPKIQFNNRVFPANAHKEHLNITYRFALFVYVDIIWNSQVSYYKGYVVYYSLKKKVE